MTSWPRDLPRLRMMPIHLRGTSWRKRDEEDVTNHFDDEQKGMKGVMDAAARLDMPVANEVVEAECALSDCFPIVCMQFPHLVFLGWRTFRNSVHKGSSHSTYE